MDHNKKYFIRTGGSVKGIKMMGVSKSLSEKHTFDVIASCSVTAITCVLEALKRFDVIEDAMMSFTKKNMFGKYVPFIGDTVIPSLRGCWRLLTSKPSLGKFGELKNTIQNYMTPELFYKWKNTCKTELYVYCFCIEDNEIVEFNLRNYEYEEVLDIMIMSSNVPIILPPVLFKDKYYCDIGFFHPNGSYHIFKHHEGIGEIISLFNREQKDKRFSFRNKLSKYLFPIIAQKEFFDSKTCEEKEIEFCEANNIKYRSIAIGKTEVDSYSDAGTTEEKLKDWNDGLKIGRK